MSTHKFREIPHISLDLLRKLVSELPGDEIKRLPVEKLPECIPEDIVEEAPYYSRAAVENLIMAANAYHLSMRMRLQRAVGDEVIAAIDHAHHAGASATVRVFRTKVLELIAARQHAARGEGKTDMAQYAAHIKRLNDLLIDVRTEQANTLRMQRLLEANMPADPALRPTVARAEAQLGRAVTEVEQLLGQFFTARLQLVRQEMSRKRMQVEAMVEKRETLRLQLQMLNKELGEMSGGLFSRALRSRQNKAQKEQIQAQIVRLVTDLKTTEVAISETDLTRWLDAVVDASLHRQAREFLRELLVKSRTLLYSLLNHYCIAQEDAARQIASNPFIQVEPKDAIRYMLKSEEFILKYFARKREQASAWLSNVAQVRMDDLDSLERDLIHELRRSLKR
ncbi:hypothetical protein [Acidihalobacter ferrooxydans]|uniref:Uncharacterized protein n=1 Tax=Acidihalobacter ferrooxydans TaxID=1765967 RepID=A0A1P8UKN6_9GAMM|nr:hypothetical protein [Acidihalobacter ferrooxydans]APZ44393.1 hypothetical protein BW247_15920 [Acidihalobacter ferrooxydans]